MSASPQKTVLVTGLSPLLSFRPRPWLTRSLNPVGASGFLASYVIDSFLANGWAVKGTVRSSAKAQHLLERYPAGSLVSLVEVKDIVTGEGLAEALEGVDAVAHTASPCESFEREMARERVAVEGLLS
jgi:nucleoside-diphosphate-sugar epimerase